MKLSRDAMLGIGILAALLLVTVYAAIQQTRDETRIPYTSISSQPNGTLALRLWLDELGFQSAETLSSSFDPGSDIDVIFMIQPSFSVTSDEWRILDRWIEEGGVLILAGKNGVTDLAMQHFGFDISSLPAQAVEIAPALPLLKSPILESKVRLKTDFGIRSDRSDFTPLMTAGGRPVALTFPLEKGRVILSTTPDAFTNLGLKEDADAQLILNLLAWAGEEGMMWFDEWHHGFRSAEIAGPSQWLRSTPGGHAVLFSVFAVFIALILQGRAFGRPIPLRHEIKRRGPMEHVTAIANLSRKAGHRSEVAHQFHRRLKRHLGQRYRLDPSTRDEEYVNVLASYNPSIEREALLRLLTRLSQPDVSEAELLKLSAEAARWMGT